jgi:hypothetical protein
VFGGSPRRLGPAEDEAGYERELVGRYLLAWVGVGIGDSTASGDRSTLFEFIRFRGRPVFTGRPADVDRFLGAQRRQGRVALIVRRQAWCIGKFFTWSVNARARVSRM